MKKYNKEQLKEMNKLLEKFKQSSDTVIPNDCYRNSEIVSYKKEKVFIS